MTKKPKKHNFEEKVVTVTVLENKVKSNLSINRLFQKQQLNSIHRSILK